MKDTVVVQNMTLTRAQVEAALRELNTPVALAPGTPVKWGGRERSYLVLGGTMLQLVSDKWGVTRSGTTTITDGIVAYDVPTTDLTVVK